MVMNDDSGFVRLCCSGVGVSLLPERAECEASKLLLKTKIFTTLYKDTTAINTQIT